VRNNLNPDFSKFIECDYYFEREQHLKFVVYDVDDQKKDFIGQTETTVARIIGSVRQTYLDDLTLENNKTSRGKIIVRLDSVNVSNDEVRMKVRASL
jgi:C2 domain